MSTLSLLQLPDELILRTLSNLDLVNLVHTSQTCRQLYTLSFEPTLHLPHIANELAGDSDSGEFDAANSDSIPNHELRQWRLDAHKRRLKRELEEDLVLMEMQSGGGSREEGDEDEDEGRMPFLARCQCQECSWID